MRAIQLPLAISLLLILSPSFAGECPAESVASNTLKQGPAQSKDIAVNELASLDLSAEKIALPKRRLRMRTIIIAPGGHVLLHSHNDRPALAMVTSGEVLEYVNHCKEPIRHKTGDIIKEHLGVSHWVKNTSDHPAVLTVSDIVNDANKGVGSFK